MHITFNGPLVHHLLLREVEDSKLNAVSVNLFGNKCRFGRKEFYLITELKYRRRIVKKHRNYARLKTLYFKDKVGILVSEFEDMYEKA